MNWKVLGLLYVLAAVAAADCSEERDAYMRIYDIGDRTAGDVMAIVIQTNYSLANTTRNLDVIVIDQYERQVGSKIQTKFPDNDANPTMTFQVKTSNWVNGTYRVKAIMDVFYQNSEDEVCGQIEYSNHFRINSDRKYYAELPQIFDIGVGFDVKDFRTGNQSCDNGMCVTVNVSGKVPSNWTVRSPLINISLQNQQGELNLNNDVNFCYPYSYVKPLLNNLSSAANALTLCVNKSADIENCNVQIKSEYSKRLSAESDKSQCQVDFEAYKGEHPYTTDGPLIGGFVAGVVALFLVMHFYNMKTANEGPHEATQ